MEYRSIYEMFDRHELITMVNNSIFNIMNKENDYNPIGYLNVFVADLIRSYTDTARRPGSSGFKRAFNQVFKFLYELFDLTYRIYYTRLMEGNDVEFDHEELLATFRAILSKAEMFPGMMEMIFSTIINTISEINNMPRTEKIKNKGMKDFHLREALYIFVEILNMYRRKRSDVNIFEVLDIFIEDPMHCEAVKDFVRKKKKKKMIESSLNSEHRERIIDELLLYAEECAKVKADTRDYAKHLLERIEKRRNKIKKEKEEQMEKERVEFELRMERSRKPAPPKKKKTWFRRGFGFSFGAETLENAFENDDIVYLEFLKQNLASVGVHEDDVSFYDTFIEKMYDAFEQRKEAIYVDILESFLSSANGENYLLIMEALGSAIVHYIDADEFLFTHKCLTEPFFMIARKLGIPDAQEFLKNKFEEHMSIPFCKKLLKYNYRYGTKIYGFSRTIGSCGTGNISGNSFGLTVTDAIKNDQVQPFSKYFNRTFKGVRCTDEMIEQLFIFISLAEQHESDRIIAYIIAELSAILYKNRHCIEKTVELIAFEINSSNYQIAVIVLEGLVTSLIGNLLLEYFFQLIKQNHPFCDKIEELLVRHGELLEIQFTATYEFLKELKRICDEHDIEETEKIIIKAEYYPKKEKSSFWKNIFKRF